MRNKRNLMSDKIRNPINEWYETYWKDRETSKFKIWFLEYNGDYMDQIEEDKEDYYICRAFALTGWLGRGGELE